jgi:hypothetical protein
MCWKKPRSMKIAMDLLFLANIRSHKGVGNSTKGIFQQPAILLCYKMGGIGICRQALTVGAVW